MSTWRFTVDQHVRYFVDIEAETEVEARGDLEQGVWDDTNNTVVDEAVTLVAMDGEAVTEDARTRVLIVGNPVRGITIYGPFETDEDAMRYGEQSGHDTWWIWYLEDPS